MSLTEAKRWVAMAEHMPIGEVKALAEIAAMDVPIDPEDPLENMMVWLCDIINRFMTIRNDRNTRYSDDVLADIDMCLYHLIDKDAKTQYSNKMPEYIECREATRALLVVHFKEYFTGDKPYQLLDKMPVIHWAWERGSVLIRLETFTSLFILAKQTKETCH